MTDVRQGVSRLPVSSVKDPNYKLRSFDIKKSIEFFITTDVRFKSVIGCFELTELREGCDRECMKFKAFKECWAAGKRIICFSVNRKDHWTSVYVHCGMHQVIVCDSIGNYSSASRSVVRALEWVKYHLEKANVVANCDISNFERFDMPSNIRQTNVFDCGIFSIMVSCTLLPYSFVCCPPPSLYVSHHFMLIQLTVG